jgi:hypothetical protein
VCNINNRKKVLVNTNFIVFYLIFNGSSEFILRYLIWLALSTNSEYRDKRFHIVTGPRIDIAADLIKRTRDIVSLNYQKDWIGKEVIVEIKEQKQ